MSPVQIVFGANYTDRVIIEADKLLEQYRRDIGFSYHEYKSMIPLSILVPEDLAVTLLVSSQVGWRAFQSLQQYGHTINLDKLPQVSLECTNPQERMQLVEVITQMAQWPGFAASVSTKVLHKKRPDLVPILDNQAIFGAYMNPRWPGQKAPQESVKARSQILQAVEWIFHDLTRIENIHAWQILRQKEPSRTLIQIFDSVWWMYFREVQPVKQNTGT